MTAIKIEAEAEAEAEAQAEAPVRTEMPMEKERLSPEEHEERLNFWRLCDELTVLQAAALIVGVDPSDERSVLGYEGNAFEPPKGYAAAKAALMHSIMSGRLKAVVRHSAREWGWAHRPANLVTGEEALHDLRDRDLGGDERLSRDHSFAFNIFPDWNRTTVQVDALREWLAARGFKAGFFFPREGASPDYLSATHPRYAPKLAAAVKAWIAIADPKGKTPKQALMKWLREHSAELGLSDDEGKPNELGIEECAKVANWQGGGGAPRTPSL